MSLCAASLCVTPGSVRAQVPSQISIDWSGPPSCLKSERFDSELARRLGPAASAAEPTRMRVQVAELPGAGYRLTLETQGPESAARRSVELETCDEVQRAAALLIATALSPAVAHEVHEEEVPERPWSLRAAAFVDVSALPRVSAGPSLGAGFDTARVRTWLDARYLIARDTQQPEAARSQIDLFTLAVGAARVWRFGVLGLGPLGELELGVLRGRANAERAAEGRAAPWLAVLGGALLEADLGRVSLDAALVLGVPLLRPEFLLEGQSDVYRTRPVTGRVQLGLKIPLGRARAASKKNAAAGQY